MNMTIIICCVHCTWYCFLSLNFFFICSYMLYITIILASLVDIFILFFIFYKDRWLLHNRTLWSTLCNTTCTVLYRYLGILLATTVTSIILLLLSYIAFYPQRHCTYIHYIYCVPVYREFWCLFLYRYIFYIYKHLDNCSTS